MKIYFDGSYRSKKLLNTWWGFIAFDGLGEVVYFAGGRERVDRIADATISEFRALLHAMEWAESHFPLPWSPEREGIQFFGDAQNVIKLMRGDVKGKKQKPYQPLLAYMRAKASMHPGWTFHWIPRSLNSLADGIATVGATHLTPRIQREIDRPRLQQ